MTAPATDFTNEEKAAVGIWKHFWIRALAPALFAVVLLAGAEAQAACINWSDAKGVIAKNGLMKPGAVRKRAIQRHGEVLSINLCRSGGRYVYRMTVIGKKKRVRDITVDARSGSKVGGRRKGRGRKKIEDRIIKRVKRNLRRHGINYY